MKQVKNRVFPLRLALVASVALGSSAALAQSKDIVSGNDIYYGLEYTSSKSSSGFNIGGAIPHAEDDVESDDVTLVWMTAPKLGAKGFTTGFRYTFRAGVEDETSVNIRIGGDPATTNVPGLDFEGDLSYDENYRAAASYNLYYSFAERYHPYLTAGAYYVDVDASMKGTADANNGAGGRCADRSVDVSEIGTTGGFVYGIGMLVNFTKKLALTLAYEITDNVDGDFDISCDDENYTVASFDSRIESYSLGLAYSF